MLPKNETDTPSDRYLRGSRNDELTNHLGNVLSVITGKKMGVSSGGGIIVYYRAEVLSQNDYYPRPYRKERSGERLAWSSRGENTVPARAQAEAIGMASMGKKMRQKSPAGRN